MRALFRWRQWRYDLDTNLLFRPALVLATLLALGLVLPAVEFALVAQWPAVATASRLLGSEPGTAQTLLVTVAGAVMTVVSVVYSILVVAFTLLSIQFSTRILAGFMRDRPSRNVLGLFVGTFAYCLAVVRCVRSDPPQVPGIAVAIGLFLALLSLSALVHFIHHVVRSIQANVLIDRIATEAEAVIAAVFAEQGPTAASEEPTGPLPHVVAANRAGYVQILDIAGLCAIAGSATVRVCKSNGAFVAPGVPLCRSDQPLDPEAVRACFDVGPERTMQDDVEFGLRQIVDIALKALSPAVNDPSTAATCIDQLGRLLHALPVRTCGPVAQRTAAGGKVWVARPTSVELLDLAVEQIRQYGRADMATALRWLRVLGELAERPFDGPFQRRVREHADAVVVAAQASFSPADCEELLRRRAAIGPLGTA